MSTDTDRTKQTVQTTGHSWDDGDLQELNNPLPRWWLWGFYATVVFALIYWVIYPAWPIGKTYTKGWFNTITYKGANGQAVTTHWNTRALFIKDMQAADTRQKKYLGALMNASFEQIAHSQTDSAFAYSMAKVMFADNCAVCHQAGGAGKVGLFPNLADDSWLWGGTYKDIQQTITYGRHGFMPSFRPTFNKEQLGDVANYVLSLSGHKVDEAKAKKGDKIFNGQTGGCYYCHTHAGTGLTSQGSANLTDDIWTIANVNGEPTLKGKLAVVEHVIINGVSRTMPAWKRRLSPADIKVLAFYVHELGGGQ